MKKQTIILASLSAVLMIVLLAGCSQDSGNSNPPRIADTWQNPHMSPNPTSNIHSDSYMSDTYAFAGPVSAAQTTVSQVGPIIIKDPQTGADRNVFLGECAAHAFDAQGNIQTVCAGLRNLQDPDAPYQRYVVTIDRATMDILAFYPFLFTPKAGEPFSFGGAGYFYQDQQYRMVVALSDGHVLTLRRVPSAAGGIDGYTADNDYNVTGQGGAVPVPQGLTKLDLYAVVPDKNGNIWFTTSQAVAGAVIPGNPAKVVWIDLNDPNFTGRRLPQSDGAFQEIYNSHAVDEGDGNTDSSGVYIVTTHRIYRLGLGKDGNPAIAWSSDYDRGIVQKSGQVSQGSGTTPTIFRMDNRRFVTIADNARHMNVNVYRAETSLNPGEERLFAQATPFGQNEAVSDENSLIVAPGADGWSADIYAENNFGNDSIGSTLDSAVTKPGFARLHLSADGIFAVASLNSHIAVPSVVSKMSLASNIVYTYNKTPDGWYLTGLDGDDLNNIRFSAKVGPGTLGYNNFYAGLSLDADGKTIWIGTLFGLTRVQLEQ